MLIIYSAVIIIASLVTFLCYAIDKGQAQRGGYRISEKTLLTLGIIGGALGGLLGMKVFRHKTKHWYFTAINFIAILAHIALFVYLSNIA